MVNFKPCFIFNGQFYAHQFLFSASCTYFLAPAPLKRKNGQQKKTDLCLLGVLGPAFHFIRVIRTLNIPNILLTAFVSKFGHHQPLR